MKKLLCLVLALLISGCGATGSSSAPAPAQSSEAASASSASEASPPVRVAALKGPTAMGMVKLIEDDKATGGYEFTIAGAIDAVAPKIASGDVDIAAVPANMASVLYNNTKGKIKVLAVNTLGVLYIAEKGDTIHSMADLRGKTIYTAGKGATPEYALDFALRANGLDPARDVTVEYRSEHAECVAMLLKSPDCAAMLPQPFLAAAMLKNDSIRQAIDLNEAWSASQSGSPLLTGVIVARSDFISSHPEEIKAFLERYKASVEYVSANGDAAAKLIAALDIVLETAAKKALPYCGITFIEGDEMKKQLSAYLGVLYQSNPKSIGGALPDEGFYYLG